MAFGLLDVAGPRGSGAGQQHAVVWCGSRRVDRPLHRRGVPTQFVHNPKAGGTSIQDFLAQVAAHRRVAYFEKNGGGELRADPPRRVWDKAPHQTQMLQTSVPNGQVFVGHRRKGSDMPALDAQRPLFVVVLREPVSVLRSVYQYVASRFPQGHLNRVVNERLRAAGVPQEQWLDRIVLGGAREVVAASAATRGNGTGAGGPAAAAAATAAEAAGGMPRRGSR